MKVLMVDRSLLIALLLLLPLQVIKTRKDESQWQDMWNISAVSQRIISPQGCLFILLRQEELEKGLGVLVRVEED